MSDRFGRVCETGGECGRQDWASRSQEAHVGDASLLFALTKDQARTLGDAMTHIQKPDGSIRPQWLMRSDADYFWIHCLGASIEALDMLWLEL